MAAIRTVTMFDLKTLAVIQQIKVGPGLDGIMYDEPNDKIILTNHTRLRLHKRPGNGALPSTGSAWSFERFR
jgi:hypothetical protein